MQRMIADSIDYLGQRKQFGTAIGHFQSLRHRAADMQLARNLACEYGPHNIRVNCIAPGLIKTDFAKALWDNPENLKASTSRSPLLRIGIPDEIAGAAVFLASAAGSFLTGHGLVVDGGATI